MIRDIALYIIVVCYIHPVCDYFYGDTRRCQLLPDNQVDESTVKYEYQIYGQVVSWLGLSHRDSSQYMTPGLRPRVTICELSLCDKDSHIIRPGAFGITTWYCLWHHVCMSDFLKIKIVGITLMRRLPLLHREQRLTWMNDWSMYRRFVKFTVVLHWV